jgi:hypothetical protein
MTDHFSSPVSGFASFLPEQYRGEFSQDWLMGLSPFEDNTCAVCFPVRQGQWVTFGMREAEEQFFKCERVAPDPPSRWVRSESFCGSQFNTG